MRRKGKQRITRTSVGGKLKSWIESDEKKIIILNLSQNLDFGSTLTWFEINVFLKYVLAFERTEIYIFFFNSYKFLTPYHILIPYWWSQKTLHIFFTAWTSDSPSLFFIILTTLMELNIKLTWIKFIRTRIITVLIREATKQFL